MRLRYKRSVLGVAWTLLNPLAQLLVFSAIFPLISPISVPNYPSFLFTGILAWNWLQSSLLLATVAVVDNRELIRRPAFPAAILPAVTVTSHLIHFLMALPVLLVFLLWGGSKPTGAVLALPLVVALQFALTLGLAYVAAASHVMFRDTQYLLGVLLQLLFFLTPVFYDAGVIPERYLPVYRLNPMVHVIDAYRTILLRGELPDGTSLLWLCGLAVGLLCMGYAVFSRVSYHFVEEL
jgi:lipopolysaccharide transport system permease protein